MSDRLKVKINYLPSSPEGFAPYLLVVPNLEARELEVTVEGDKGGPEEIGKLLVKFGNLIAETARNSTIEEMWSDDE